MDDNLVGYLLKSLDDETQQQVEASLQSSPELRARLKLMERALAPLAADADTPEPPSGLVLSTLARIAEHQCHKLPPAPPPPRSQRVLPMRRWGRRPNVLVAALLLVVLGGVGASALVHLWRDRVSRLECANNLRLIGEGLRGYCVGHDGDFPRVEEKGPRSVAGIFVPVLRDNGMLSPQVSVVCPARGRTHPQVDPSVSWRSCTRTSRKRFAETPVSWRVITPIPWATAMGPGIMAYAATPAILCR